MPIFDGMSLPEAKQAAADLDNGRQPTHHGKPMVDEDEHSECAEQGCRAAIVYRGPLPGEDVTYFIS